DGHQKAWAYVANPRKDHTRKLFRKPSNKVIIPGGDWEEYVTELEQHSLERHHPITDTFGTETEFSLYGHIENDGWKRLPHLKYHGQYKVTFQDGKTLRYANLTKLLSQALYYNLSQEDIGRRVLGYYYEKRPQVNTHFLIPFGFAYIDGETLPDDGTQEAVRRLYPQEIKGELHQSKYKKAQVASLPAEDTFLEFAGFPMQMQKQAATSYAKQEMTRRFFLCKALEQIQFIEYNGTKIDELEIRTHSSHYSHKLNPLFFGSNLAERKTSVKGANKKDAHLSKYTDDVAKVLGMTFGPIITYFTSGKPGHIEYKVRQNNRLEFRSTPIHSTEQFQAACNVFSASIITTQESIKQGLAELVEAEFGKAADKVQPKDLLRFYAKVKTDRLLSHFDFHIPVEYENSLFRYGYMIPEDSSYQQALRGPNQPIQTSRGKKTFKEIIQDLWEDPFFTGILKKSTTPQEYNCIEKFIENPEKIEALSGNKGKISSRQCLDQINRGGIMREIQSTATFPNWYTNFVFANEGVYSFCDRDHKMILRLNRKMEQQESDLYLDSAPLEIILCKLEEGEWKDIDKIEQRVSLENFENFRNCLQKDHRKVWETFYKMK
ncbi:MAG: hypothetical protein ACQESG_03245, partial [Nanobdellota archaeon]